MGLSTTRRTFMIGTAALGVAHRASAQGLYEVRFGQASKSLVSSAPRIADEMGFYAKHGIKPKFMMIDTGNGATTALISGSIDVAITGSADAIAPHARGQNVVIIADLFRGLTASLVIAKPVADRLGVSPTAPIAERLKALDGLTIATTAPTSPFPIAYGQAAKAVGATIKFTYMALPAMQAAMESGAIQGFTGTAPYWTFSVLRGTGVFWINGPRGELPSQYLPVAAGILSAMRPFCEAHSDIVRGIAAATQDLADAFDTRPNDVKAAIGRVFPEFSSELVDLLFEAEGPAFKTKPLTAADMAREIAFVKLGGTNLPGIDSIKPADLIYP